MSLCIVHLKQESDMTFIEKIITDRLERAARIARMATDALGGLKKVDKALELYADGLLTEEEAIEWM